MQSLHTKGSGKVFATLGRATARLTKPSRPRALYGPLSIPSLELVGLASSWRRVGSGCLLGQAQHIAGSPKDSSDGRKSDRVLDSTQAKVCKAVVGEDRVWVFPPQSIVRREIRSLCLPNFASCWEGLGGS